MTKNNFKKMTKEDRVETYGGFAFLTLIPVVISLFQTIVMSSIAIYQAVSKKNGSVSFGGTKAITQKYPPEKQEADSPRSRSTSVKSFTAY